MSEPPGGGDRPVDGAELAELRRPVFAIAYRMLGSVSEAEDVVQETLLAVHRTLAGGEEIRSLPAYAATVATRLSINELRSARVRRVNYVGAWLPEPLLGSDADDPERSAELADSLSMALLVVLETLTPEQRAALLLRDVFGYDYDRVAEVLGRTPAAVRQIASRARREVAARRPRFRSSRERQAELAAGFLAAARDGDLGRLETVLAHDVRLSGDGGGKVPALARTQQGRARVSRTLVNWFRLGADIPGVTWEVREVNGGSGVISYDPWHRVISVLALEADDDGIRAIHGVINPDKLQHLGAVSELDEVLRLRT